jgi:hypothetical protein
VGGRTPWCGAVLHLPQSLLSLIDNEDGDRWVWDTGKMMIGRRNWSDRRKASVSATGWMTGVRFLAVARIFFSSPPRLDRVWGSPSLLSNGYLGLFLRGWSSRSVKLTTHLPLVPGEECVELYLHFPIRIHDMLLSYTTDTSSYGVVLN